MRVCFLLGKIATNGGIGRVTSILANELAKDPDFKINLLCYSDQHFESTYPIAENIQLDYLMPVHCSMAKAMLFKNAVGRLKKYLKENKIDVIIAAGVVYYPVAILAAKAAKAKCICWEHCNVRTGSDVKFEKLCRKIGAKYAHLCVPLTKQDAADYREFFGTKNVIQMYNPVDQELFARRGEYNADTKKIITVGRLSYQKYYEKLVEVANIVLKRHPDYSWDIFGEGPDRVMLEGLIKESSLEGRLSVMGQVPDLYDRYKNYSVQVMTSRYEGFPMVLLEGAANGLPLVSFDIFTGPNEIITDGENGRLIPAFDAEKMADAITEIIENDSLRLSMSKKSLDCVQNFRLEPISAEWKRILKEL